VHHVRLNGVEHVADLLVQPRVVVGVRKRSAAPVVHELDDGQIVVDAPGQLAMRTRGIVLGREHAHVMVAAKLAAQLERVDLRAGDVTRQKVVDRVQDVQRHQPPLASWR